MITLARAAVIPVVALALLAGCGSDGKGSEPAPSSTPTVSPTTSMPDEPAPDGGTEILVTVGTDDAVTLGSRVEPVPLGSEVSLRLVDDAKAEEYHVHGYDLEQSVDPGVEAAFTFTADQPGRFEVESHTTGDVLVVLEVG
jgi:hypothetical protein